MTRKKNRKRNRKRKAAHASSDEAAAVLPPPPPPASSRPWAQAFAAAASVEPVSLGDDWNDKHVATVEGEGHDDSGLSQLSKLAAATKNQPPIRNDEQRPAAKRQKTASWNDADDFFETPQTLEGRMVPHPKQTNEQVMVLVDAVKRHVYSATDRCENGELILLGRLKDCDSTTEIEWHKDAFPEESTASPTSTQPSFPYPVDADDHCETPLEAYQDIVPFLELLRQKTAESEDFVIYDPYYCDGSVKRHFSSLGFSSVYNEKEDCYQVWENPSRYPKCHVLVTNPPYSQDHILKLMQHVVTTRRPWFLLMPNWVHKKDYYRDATKDIQPFYLVPKKRYVYVPPKHFREAKDSDVHKKSSPFVSQWYIWGGTHQANEQLIQQFYNDPKLQSTCDLARSKSALRDLRRKASKHEKT